MTDQNAPTPKQDPNAAKPPRWIGRWPILLPFVLVGGLLWYGLWASRRAESLDGASYVAFEAPAWAWLPACPGPPVNSLLSRIPESRSWILTGIPLLSSRTTPP